MNHDVKATGIFTLECWNPDGSLAWRREAKNSVTLAGLDQMVGSSMAGVAQVSTWYAGLIDKSGFSGLAIGDTMALHSGWSESVAYSGNRPQWVNQSSGQQASSNGPFTFPITGTGIIHGMFITSSSVKGGNSGILFSTAELSSDANISAGQNLTGTYQVKLAGG